MVQIDPRASTRSTRLEDAADIVEEGMTQVHKKAEAVAEQAQDLITTAAEGVGAAVDDIDPAAVEHRARQALRRLGRTGGAECSELVVAARNRERLKSALIVGVVVFILSSVTFVIAREIANRRAAERRRATAGASTVRPQPSSADDAEAER